MADATIFTRPRSLDEPYPDVRAVIQQYGQELPPDALNGAEWSLTDASTVNHLRSMTVLGVPLYDYVRGRLYYGVKTGFNEAFIIDGPTRARLMAEDAKSEEVIKPLVVGKDIRKWRIADRDRWLIYSPWDLDIEAFPAIKAHLSRYRLELESRPECNAGRYNWWCLARYGSEYVDAFSMPKIMYPVITKESSFAFDTKGSFTNDKGYIIPLNDLYLLGVLNSSSAWRNIAAVCSPLRGGFFELRSTHLGKIPVPNAALRERHIIADLVQQCLDARGVGCGEWEAEIDARVARLYGL